MPNVYARCGSQILGFCLLAILAGCQEPTTMPIGPRALVPRPTATLKGIYINQATQENRHKLDYLIRQAKKHGIQTFLIDLQHITPQYEKNVILLHNRGIQFIARVPIELGDNAEDEQGWQALWTRKLLRIQTAVRLGAKGIQLHYHDLPLGHNARSMQHVLAQALPWLKHKLAHLNAKLELSLPATVPMLGEHWFDWHRSLGALCPTLSPSRGLMPHVRWARKLQRSRAPLVPIVALDEALVAGVDAYSVSWFHQMKNLAALKAGSWYAWQSDSEYEGLFHWLNATIE